MPRPRPTDLLPKEERDKITVQLDRVGDQALREWIDDELYHGKKQGRIPREWGPSAFVKAVIRREYQPLNPAPAAQPVPPPTPPKKQRRTKSDT